jgi:orotate phosphoribosyltransferase
MFVISLKEHGLGNRPERYYEKGMEAAVIENHIYTGEESLEGVNVLKRSRLEMCELLSIFNYGFEEAGEAFKSTMFP